MKNLFLVFFLITASVFGQPTGTLSTIVNGNSVEIKLDSTWRNCGSQYDQQVFFNGDSITWLQVDWGMCYGCLCPFNYSVTVDSLPEGIYTASVYFTYVQNSQLYDSLTGTWYYTHTPCDTTYQESTTFTILSVSSNPPFKSNSFASNCLLTSIENHSINENTPYPNPTNNSISFKAMKSDESPELLDIFGHEVKSYSIERDGDYMRLSLTHLSAGIYYLRYSSKVYKIIRL
ncbi:MAG: hypothetical protein NTW10_02690 [Bacteroidetes bacterium]|nr:hypothetical protein [Bacteroidota bacterium]